MSSFRSIADRVGGWPRRLAALACLVLAGLSAMRSRSPAPLLQTRPVIVAARSLGAGTAVTAADVRLAVWPRSAGPPGAFASAGPVIGRTVAGPIGAGEPLTPARLLGSALTAGLPVGTVGATVRLADTADGALVRPGDTVDLIAAPNADSNPSGSTVRTLATAVKVLAVLPTTDGSESGTSLVVSVDHSAALRLASALGQPILVTVRVP